MPKTFKHLSLWNRVEKDNITKCKVYITCSNPISVAIRRGTRWQWANNKISLSWLKNKRTNFTRRSTCSCAMYWCLVTRFRSEILNIFHGNICSRSTRNSLFYAVFTLDFHHGGCTSKRGRIHNHNLWAGEWFLPEMYLTEMMACCL